MGDRPVVEQEKLSRPFGIAAFVRLEEMSGAEVLKNHEAAKRGQRPKPIAFCRGGGQVVFRLHDLLIPGGKRSRKGVSAGAISLHGESVFRLGKCPFGFSD